MTNPADRADNEPITKRESVPDPELIVRFLLDEYNSASSEEQARLDQIGTLTGLTEDDLIEVILLLVRRVRRLS